MSTPEAGQGAEAPAEYNRTRLFVASCIALVATAFAFSIRAEMLGELGEHFGLGDTLLGWIALAGIWGFPIAILIGGPLCDVFGMGPLLRVALICHIVGTVGTVLAGLVPETGFWPLFGSTLVIALGNGLVEATINPLAATIYPEQKTHKLNLLHAWWPGGLVIGGLGAYALTQFGLGWQVKICLVLVPAVVYGIMFTGQKFPATERVQAGVSTGEMWREAVKPLFLLWLLCMVCTASTELGPGQWVPKVVTDVLQDTTAFAGAGTLVFVWIAGVMLVGRLFAGPIVHRITPIGLLAGSAVFAAIGLRWLATVDSVVSAFIAATIFAVGVCYFWPTMLGVTSERFPKGGALLLAVVGATGMISAGAAQPVIGWLSEHKGPNMAFGYFALLPTALIILFGAMFVRDLMKGGYQVVKLGEGEGGESSEPASDEGQAADEGSEE
ncbi:MAG: MFS transporter [Armatimonadota bacterium]